MKIAIPTRNGQVDDHFGHCEYYTIAEIGNDNSITATSQFKTPEGCGCKSDVASQLSAMGVKTLLAGNMGQGAVNKIEQENIAVVRGCQGDVGILLNSYLNGIILDSGDTCSGGHGEGHECSH